jgi:hypothetical protein
MNGLGTSIIIEDNAATLALANDGKKEYREGTSPNYNWEYNAVGSGK